MDYRRARWKVRFWSRYLRILTRPRTAYRVGLVNFWHLGRYHARHINQLYTCWKHYDSQSDIRDIG